MFGATGIIIAVIGLIHSFLGEKVIVKPLLAGSSLSGFANRTVRIAWHMTTLFWFAIAACFIALQFGTGKFVKHFLLIQAVAFGIAFIISIMNSKGRHISWTGFLAAAILSGYLATMG